MLPLREREGLYHLVTKEGKGRENMVTETKMLGGIIW